MIHVPLNITFNARSLEVCDTKLISATSAELDHISDLPIVNQYPCASVELMPFSLPFQLRVNQQGVQEVAFCVDEDDLFLEFLKYSDDENCVHIQGLVPSGHLNLAFVQTYTSRMPIDQLRNMRQLAYDWAVAQAISKATKAVPRACSHCSKVAKTMKVCSGCKAQHYCGQACQAAAWPLHKKVCCEHQQTQGSSSSSSGVAKSE